MRERIEDLGVICERLAKIIDDYESSVKHIESKHAWEEFLSFYSKEGNLEDLHMFLRHFKDHLVEIYHISRYGFGEIV